MTTYTGQQNVEPGLYLNLKNFSITHVDTSGPLPGADAARYYRVPMLLMLAAAPLAGLAFVIFLPLIGFAMAARLLGDTLMQWTATAVIRARRVVQPSWAPSVAFLGRSRTAKTDTAATPAADAWKDDVEKKMDAANHDER
jgi:hypothetical protein